MPQETVHLFIQEGSTKKYDDMESALHRICQMLRLGEPDGRARAVLAGDQETFAWIRSYCDMYPKYKRMLFLWPGDWHILYHLAKALLKRYWGAGLELVAKALGGDDSNAAEGKNYRRVHHQLTVLYECFMIVIVATMRDESDSYFKEGADGAREVREWIKRRAEQHTTFRFWARFLLHDYPAYAGVRMGVRTGNLKLRNACLRMVVAIFCGYGKDHYQVMMAGHLGDITCMTDLDYETMCELFSTSLGGDAFARVGLDERQEVANRAYKGTTKKITKEFVSKLAAIVGARETAVAKIEEIFLTGSSEERPEGYGEKKLSKKRVPSVKKGVEVVTKCLAFRDEGCEALRALDGRLVPATEGEEILGVPSRCDELWAEVIKKEVLKDTKAKGATKKKLKSIPPARTSSKPTKEEGRASALQRRVKDITAQSVEQHRALNLILSYAGSLSPEAVLQTVLEIGVVVPQAVATEAGGTFRRNKINPYTDYFNHAVGDHFASAGFISSI